MQERDGGWRRLEELTRRVARRPGSLDDVEVDEFVRRYRRASSELSFVRAEYADPGLDGRLTMLVANASSALYRRTESPVAGFRRFVAVTFPAALWHLRWFVLAATLIFFVPWLLVGIWMQFDPEVLELLAPEEARATYVDGQFAQYYQDGESGGFAVGVTVNNIRVAFLAWALGVTFGLGTVWIVAYNGFNVGVAWGIFVVAGAQGRFFSLILPHGLLELTAIIVAGAAGLAMGFSLVRPGDRRRGVAFTQEARRSVVVVLGLMGVFFTAGMIEGFVTGRPWPAVLRLGIGGGAWVLFLTYVGLLGSRAAARGFTGLWSEAVEGDTARTVVQL